MTKPLVSFALSYAEHGLRVFPLQPRNKIPLKDFSWNVLATTDAETIKGWWQKWPDANIGIATGKGSGIVVLDVDVTKANGEDTLSAMLVRNGDLPKTINVKTGTGGRHYYFKYPEIEIRNSAGMLGPGLDVRGEGGFVVAPPSIHPNGKPYEWGEKADMQPLPPWLLNMMYAGQEKSRPQETPEERPDALEGQTVLIPHGQRNETLAKMAGTMRRRGFGYDAIVGALIAENLAKCVPPLSDAEVLRIADSISEYNQEQQAGTVRDKQAELEWMLCAAAFADPEMAIKECGFVNPSLFHESKLYRLWDGLMRGKDKIALATELDILNDLLEMRGRINLADMSKYADQVARMMYLEDVSIKLGDMQKHLSSLEYEKVQTDIGELSGMTPIAGRRPKDAHQSASEFLAILDNLGDRSIKTWIADLDAKTGGMERQTLTVLGARPSMGKTTLALQIARSNAASGRRVLFFSLEMSSNQLWAKMACGALGIRWRDVRDNQVSSIVIKQIKDKVKELSDVYGQRLLFEDGQSDSPSIWYQVARERPDLIIIDHLRLVADHEENEVRRLGTITNQVKMITKKFNCAGLLLCQLNRKTEGRAEEEKRPQLADLRESGHIEENADNVWMIYRPSYYGESGDETEILIRKFRDDVLSQKAVAKFNANAQWFE